MTRRGAISIDQLADDFSGRLAALSAVHSAVFEAGGDMADLADIIARTFSPYYSDGENRIIAEGPSLQVNRDTGTTFALCLHELATNALKYGSLSRPEGRVHLVWDLKPGSEPILTIKWTESNGPPVTEPSKPGYGTRYIRSSLRSLFGSPPEIVFDPEGLRCIAAGPYSRIRGIKT
jgi:two-component sensor histidine kinase